MIMNSKSHLECYPLQLDNTVAILPEQQSKMPFFASVPERNDVSARVHAQW